MLDSTRGDAIKGFDTDKNPVEKPANLGEAGGTHGGLFVARRAPTWSGPGCRPVDPPGVPPPEQSSCAGERAAVSPLRPPGQANASGGNRGTQGFGAGQAKSEGCRCDSEESRTVFRKPGTTPRKGCFCVHASRVVVVTLMILPQVHLRKPCYDFYFL